MAHSGFKEPSIKRVAGLWIDHRKAVILMITDGVEEKKQIPSDIEKHVRFSDERKGDAAEDTRDRRFTSYLNRYYDDVISTIHNAESVLVFGPGEAKREIEKRLKNTNFIGRITRIEAADKMTDRQISAKIRRHVLRLNLSGRGVSTVRAARRRITSGSTAPKKRME